MGQAKQMVIIGAGYAGMLAAVRLDKNTRGQDVQITLINERDTFVERVRMHQRATNQPVPKRLIVDMLRGTRVTFMQGRVTGIVPDQNFVAVQTSTSTQVIPYDTLVYALGSMIDRDALPGVREHAYVLNFEGERSAAALAQVLPDAARAGKRLVVVGGGLTGIEAASEFADTYPNLKVVLVTRGEVGEGVSERGRAHLRATLERLGVELHEHTGIAEIRARALRLADGSSLPFDLCLWAGAFTVPSLARLSGIAVNERGQIRVDPFLRSISHPNIYAIGDAANPINKHGVLTRMACATALPQAAQAADNIGAALLGKPETALDYAYAIQCISLGRNDGLIQFVNADDSPQERILTGRKAAVVKELVVRFAAKSSWLTRVVPDFFPAPHQPEQPVQQHTPSSAIMERSR